jgi:hypothetical protein
MYVFIMPKELKPLQTCEADCDFASMHQNVPAQKPRIVCRVQCSHMLGMLKKLLLAFNCYPQATRDMAVDCPLCARLLNNIAAPTVRCYSMVHTPSSRRLHYLQPRFKRYHLQERCHLANDGVMPTLGWNGNMKKCNT